MTNADYNPEFDPVDVDGDYGSTGGDITVPTFNQVKPFKFWCQKALPLVYDDSLSYYELLCRVVAYLNNMMTDLNSATSSISEFAEQFVTNQTFLNNMAQQLGDNTEALEDYINDRMEDFSEAYQELEDYVNNYFNNLDVQEEIDNKLDEMSTDGTFDEIFLPFVSGWITEKTEQIDNSINNQNQTLAQQNGKIAVLEGRMDTFSQLPAGSTSANAELTDIRTNFLGVTFANAGDAVRTSDFIASGYNSIPVEANVKELFLDGSEVAMNGDFSTYSVDITPFKGGKLALIFNAYNTFDGRTENGRVIYGKSNVMTPTTDGCTTFDMPVGGSLSRLKALNITDASQTTTNRGYKYLLILPIPANETYRYYYLPYTQFGEGDPSDPSYVYPPDGTYLPNRLVYATSWYATPVDATLTHANEAGDAKATGDALNELNDHIGEIDDLLENNPLTSVTTTPFVVSYPWQSGDARFNSPARLFWSEIVPANTTITSVYTYIHNVGANPEITFEIWELVNGILTIKESKTINQITANSDITCEFNNWSDKQRMVCYRSSNVNARHYRTSQTGYSWKYTSDVSSDTTTLVLSELSGYSNMKLIGGFTYVKTSAIKRDFFSGILDGNIIVFGDSTVDGSSVTGHTNNVAGTDRTATTEPNVYTSIVEGMINTFTGGSKRVYNAGFGGKTLNYIADNYATIMSAFSNVKSAILVIDANSASGTRDEYKEGVKTGLLRMFNYLKSDGISFAVMSPQPMFFYPADDGTLPAINSAGEYYIGVNIAKDLCEQYNVPFIDLAEKTNHMMQSPYLNSAYFLGDRIHFGDNGHRVEAYELYGELIHPILYFDSGKTFIGLQSNKGELSATSGISASLVGGYQSIVLSASNQRTDVLHRIYVLSTVPFTVEGLVISGWTSYYDVYVDGTLYTTTNSVKGETISAGWHEITVKPTAINHIVRYSGLFFEQA